jgi:hypothetical protein
MTEAHLEKRVRRGSKQTNSNEYSAESEAGHRKTKTSFEPTRKEQVGRTTLS